MMFVFYKKGRKEDLGNYRPGSLSLVPGKVMEQITQHVQDKQVMGCRQHGFMEGGPCLANLISCCDKVTCLVDKGKVGEVVYLDFSKASGAVFHSLLEKVVRGFG